MLVNVKLCEKRLIDPRKPLLWLRICSLVKWLSAALAVSWLLQPGLPPVQLGAQRGAEEEGAKRHPGLSTLGQR